jgi:hypothetical protein
MGSIRRNVDCLAGMNNRLFATKGGFNLPVEHDEGLLKVMAMRPGTSAGRDVHVDYAEAALCVVSIDRDGVGVANQPNMRQLSFTIWIGGS